MTQPHEYTPMPLGYLPWPIGHYCVEQAKAIGCRPELVAAPLLATVAAAIGSKAVIEFVGGYTQPSVLWCVSVAEVGQRKSAAYHAATDPIEQAEKVLVGRSGTRLICSDVTIEAMADLLVSNPSGILVACEELAGWFTSFGRYSSARGTDEPHWVQLYDAGTLRVDRRKNRHAIYVPNAAASICGTIQPAVLTGVLGNDHIQSGLASRLLMVSPPLIPMRWTGYRADSRVCETMASVVSALVEWSRSESSQVVLKANEYGSNCIGNAVNAWGEQAMALGGPSALAWSKLSGICARLSLLIHCCRWAAGDPGLRSSDEVDETSVFPAVHLTTWFAHEAFRIYERRRGETREQLRSRILDHMRGNGGRTTVRDSQRATSARNVEVRAALESMASDGLVQRLPSTSSPQGGRPTEEYRLLDS